MLPKIVQEEQDPEVLKLYLDYTLNLVSEQSAKIDRLETEAAKKSQELLNLDDRLSVLKKSHFAKSSEKRSLSRPKLKGKKQLTLHGASLLPPPSKEELGKLEEITVDHKLSTAELADIAESYGYSRESEWEHLTGFYDESEEIDVVVQSYVRKKNRRHKYRLKASKASVKEIIVSAPASFKIMPGAKYSTDFAVEVAVSKYLYHLPLERIRRQMESAGFGISVNTLYSLCFFVHCYVSRLVGAQI